jgi:hypothetical protein
MRESSRKVEDGKLVKVRIDDGVTLLGDFFLHPEESVEGLEEVIAAHIHEDTEDIAESVEEFLREQNAELLGIDADDVAETAVEARESDGGKDV